MTEIQKQEQIEVKMLNKTILPGIATGNNAAWLCVCGRKLPLIGSSYFDLRKVHCPNSGCKKIYKVYPKNGKKGDSVSHVEQC